jgi:hypothetical protein
MPIRLVQWSDDMQRAPDDPALVGQSEWCSLIPALHSALANPRAEVSFPGLHPERPGQNPLAYWETALYTLHFLLGWTDPGRGLQWWYAHGLEPMGDPRLQLLRDVWNSRGQLELLAAWCWGAGCAGFNESRNVLFDILGRQPRVSGERPLEGFLGAGWKAAHERRFPTDGGGFAHRPGSRANALHLSHSFPAGLIRPENPGVLLQSADRRQATLVFESAVGWYAGLAHAGAALPDLGPRSWHVDVFIKPIGWLGTFRRSRVTGLWFQGKHSIHLAGQDEELVGST